MKIEIDDNLWVNEYSIYKNSFLEKIKKGYRTNEVNVLRAHGISDDTIFIAELIGIYKAADEIGLIGKVNKNVI